MPSPISLKSASHGAKELHEKARDDNKKRPTGSNASWADCRED